MSKDQSIASPMPAVTFSAFVISLGSSALVGLGEVPDPATGITARDLPLARHNIDLLEMIMEKTQGNLNQDEERLLASLLCELRFKYVIIADKPVNGRKTA